MHKKLTVIQNGYDVTFFNQSGYFMERNRLNCDLKSNEIFIGFVARRDKHKDITNLLSEM